MARNTPAAPGRFADDVVALLHKGKILGIRAGSEPHRFIGVWMVVVDGRLFIRSWSLKLRSWYRTFLVDPRGAITVEGRIQKPQAFYILQRSNLDFDEINKAESFVPQVVKSVEKEPF